MNGVIEEVESVVIADISWKRSCLLQIEITPELAGKLSYPKL